MRNDSQLFLSYHPTDAPRVAPILPQLPNRTERLEDCDLVVACVSEAYLADRDAFVAQLSYAACVLRKPYILVLLEDLRDPPPDLEMLAAKNGYVWPENVAATIAAWQSAPPTVWQPISTEKKYAFKPFEACEEHYAFVSYAHDDAALVYPLIKDLYEAGWNLWYDEGIRITERYLPEIARHVRDCEIFLLFVTERSINRPFVMDFELAYARRLGKQVLPVMVEDFSSPVPAALFELELKQAGDASGLLSTWLQNFGGRVAVPPKDKKGEEYDLNDLIPMEGYDYQIDGNGIILTCCLKNDYRLKVPAEHCGIKVMGIAPLTFAGSTSEHIELPKDITYIGKNAFIKTRSNDNFTAVCALVLLVTGLVVPLAITVRASVKMTADWHGVSTIFPFLGWVAVAFIFLVICATLCGSMLAGFLDLSPFPISSVRIKAMFNKKDKKKSQSAFVICAEDDKFAERLSYELRCDGYSVDSTKKDYPVALAVITEQLIASDNAIELLRAVASSEKRIISVYFGTSPQQLPVSLQATVGQTQGVIWGEPESEKKIRIALQSKHCYANPFLGFLSEKEKISYDDGDEDNEEEIITIKKYIGKQKQVIIPRFYPYPLTPVKKISINAFANKKITSVIIPDTIIEIVGHAFSDCKRLLSVEMPDSVEKLGACAFFQCSSLESVVLSKSLKKLESMTFCLCDSLKRIFIPDSVVLFERDVFSDNMANLTIHTPAGSYAEQYAHEHNIRCQTYTPSEWEALYSER